MTLSLFFGVLVAGVLVVVGLVLLADRWWAR